MEQEKKVYEKLWFAWLMIVLFFPVGLFLMFKYGHHTKAARITLSVILAFVFMVAVATDEDESVSEADNNNNEEEIIEEEAEEEVQASQETAEELIDDIEEIETDSSTAIEEAYALELEKLSNNMSSLFGEFGDHLGRTDMYSDQWMLDVAMTLHEFDLIFAEIKSLDPGNKFKEPHDLVLNAVDYYETSFDYFVEGVDNDRTDLLELSAEYISKATLKINEATDIIALMN